MPEQPSILPPNHTEFEAAMERLIQNSRPDLTPVSQLMDPDTCPAELLGWLAWAFSADIWDASWDEATKRRVIKQSLEVHRRKGTVGAVRRALEAMGFLPKVVEWSQMEPQGAPHSFALILEILENADSPEKIAQALRAVETTKPVRSHLASVQITTATTALPIAAATVSVGQIITVGTA